MDYRFPLYNPQDPRLIVRDMLLSRSPFSLSPGYYALIQNLRWADGTFKVRDAIAQQQDVPAANLQHRGSVGGGLASDGGMNTIFSVFRETTGSTTRIYELPAAGPTWFERTATSGHFGNTRFGNSVPTDFFGLAIVTDPEDKTDAVIVCGNEELPRVFVLENSAYLMAIHREITPPSDSQQQKIVFSWSPFHVAGGSGTMPTYTNSDADFAFASTGSAPDINARLTRSTGVAAANSTAEIDWGAVTKDFSAAHQINMAVESSWKLWLDVYLKIEIRDSGGTYSVIYNGPNGLYPVRRVPMDPLSKREIWSFNLDHIAAADRDAVDRIRFTLLDATAPSAAQTLDIYAIGGGAVVPGNALYAGTYHASETRAESPRLIYGSHDTAKLSDIGGRPLTTDTGGAVKLPIDERLLYAPTVHYQNPSTAELANGVDEFRVYRKDPGEDDYYLAFTKEIATYTAGAWTLSAGTVLSVESVVDSTEPEEKKSIRLPGPFHKPLPTSIRDALWVNGRLFVIGRYDSTKYDLYVSELDNPWRFRRYNLPGETDPNAPVWVNLPTEVPVRLVSSPSSLLGSDVVYCVTDKNVYQIIGRDTFTIRQSVRRILTHGSVAPRSVLVYRGELWFFDTMDMQVRRLTASGLETPSLDRVDTDLDFSTLTSLTDLKKMVTIGAKEDLIYVGFSRTSVTLNDEVLVYNMRLDAWESNDGSFPSGVNISQFLTGVNSPAGVSMPLCAITYAGKLLEYERTGETLDYDGSSGTAPAIELRWGYSLLPDFSEFTFGNFRISADNQTSFSFTGTRTFQPGGGTLGCTTSFNSASGIGWVRSVLGSPSGKARGWACQPKLTGSYNGGKRIYRIDIEADKRRLSGAGTSP